MKNLFKKLLAGTALMLGVMAAPISAHAAEAEPTSVVIADDFLLDYVEEDEVSVLDEIVSVDTNEVDADNAEEMIEVVSNDVEVINEEVINETEETTAEETVAEEVAEETVVAETTSTEDALLSSNVLSDINGVVEPEAQLPETTQETDSESTQNITGELVGTANRGYAKLSDGSDAFCVNEELKHIDANAEYVYDDSFDGSKFNSVFVAIRNADERGLNETETRQIAQLAIWAILNPTGTYRNSVEFFYGESGAALFDEMLNTSVDGYTVNTWGYIPVATDSNGSVYQTLVSGKASITESTPTEEPEIPETPDEPEVPDVPETPETPEEPEVPVTPDVPVTPEVPVIPETPVITTTTPDVPVVTTTTTTTSKHTPQALSWTSRPQTGDNDLIYVGLLLMLIGVLTIGYAYKRRYL